MSALIIKFKPLLPKVKPLLPKVKPLLTLAVGFLAALGVLSLTHLGPAQAQSPGVNLAALVARLNADDAKLAADDAKLAADDAKLAADDTKIAALQAILPLPGPQGNPGAQGPKGDTGPAGTGSIAALTQVGKDVFFTGVNVHIVSGSGYTDDGTGGEIPNATTLTGLGNLTLGYNARGNSLGAGNVRTGSHNLILGDANNYSSFGGLVVGTDNAINGRYASVSGGVGNTASGDYVSVSGGYANTASGQLASVSGGHNNTASGVYASVSGGESNTASNTDASVSGGFGNTASGGYASVSGGSQKVQSTLYGWTGGTFHTL